MLALNLLRDLYGICIVVNLILYAAFAIASYYIHVIHIYFRWDFLEVQFVVEISA